MEDAVPSKILPYLYLGSVTHAYNRDILVSISATHVLNCALEVGCMFDPESTSSSDSTGLTTPPASPPLRSSPPLSYLHLKLKDEPYQILDDHWLPAFEFLDKVASVWNHDITNDEVGSKPAAAVVTSPPSSLPVVFVHCRAGISRSATFVVAYIMHRYKWDLDRAFGLVHERRSIVNPNPGFMRQLRLMSLILSDAPRHSSLTYDALDYEIAYLERVTSPLFDTRWQVAGQVKRVRSLQQVERWSARVQTLQRASNNVTARSASGSDNGSTSDLASEKRLNGLLARLTRLGSSLEKTESDIKSGLPLVPG